MAYDIRPLSFTEVLDRSFALLRDQFWVLVGISAVAWIPYGVLLALGGTNRRAIQVAAVLLLAILQPLAHIALAVAVSNIYLGAPASVSEAYESTRPILLPVIGTYLLLYAFLFLLALLLVLPAFYFMVCWMLVAPIMVVEQCFGRPAMSRSRALIHGSWWRSLGMLLVVGLIATVPAGALEIFWSLIPFFGPILNAATQAVTGAYSSVAIVLYYFDRRCRTEEFDLRLLAEQIRSEGGPRGIAAPGTSLA